MRKGGVPASNSRLDAGTLRCVTISKMQGAEDETDRFREEPWRSQDEGLRSVVLIVQDFLLSP